MRKLFLLSLLFLVLGSASFAATYTVTTTGDAGAGSLRQAIDDANTNAGRDTIGFNIPTAEAMTEGGATFWRIEPQTALPAITEEVHVDGASQTIWGGDLNPYGPEIEIRGDGTGTAMNGLLVQAGDCTIESLVVNNFNYDGSYAGINIGTGISYTNNRVIGCYIGVNASGEAAAANYHGVRLIGPANTIGGTLESERNIISGNTSGGIYMTNWGSNEVYGNYIGLDRTGSAEVKNGLYGVYASSDNNLIGGPNTGEGNVISGNYTTDNYPDNTGGVHLVGSYNLVRGNLIGTDWTGTVQKSNSIGVNLYSGTGNIIGGTLEAERNVISGNYNDHNYYRAYGVRIRNTSNTNYVRGNYIGLDITGTSALPNAVGVYIASTSNVIGGTMAGARNVISGNQKAPSGYGYGQHGIELATDSSSNYIQGNYIGTDKTGLVAVPNIAQGISIGTEYNMIGGSSAAARNVISGNTQHGIAFLSSAADHNYIRANYIGVDSTGAAVLPNGWSGIYGNYGDYNIIGGSGSEEGNVIAGNTQSGINLESALYNTIEGNYIGTNASGDDLGNAEYGVRLFGSGANTQYNQVGPNNVIAYNDLAGVAVIWGGGGTNLRASFNKITRNSMYKNYRGIYLYNTANQGIVYPQILSTAYNVPGAGDTTITGTATSSGIVEIFKAEEPPDEWEKGEGQVYLKTVTAEVDGAWIATIEAAQGLTATQAVTATVTDNNWNTSEFSFNSSYEVDIFTVTSTADAGNNTLRQCILNANEYSGLPWIGIPTISFQLPTAEAIDGGGYYYWSIRPTTDLPAITKQVHINGRTQPTSETYNNPYGPEVEVYAGDSAFDIQASYVTIEGLAINGGVDSNSLMVQISTANGHHCRLIGNYIGLDVTGEARKSAYGIKLVRCYNGAHHNIIGGTLESERNIVLGPNGGYGVSLYISTSNEVKGNYIGTNKSGTVGLGAGSWGVYIYNADHNLIGGSTAAERNIISGHGYHGVEIYNNSDHNVVAGNYIGLNAAGTAILANSDRGVYIWGASSNNTIGGSEPGLGNIISGNNNNGIYCNSVSDNYIRGNYIGLGPDGVTDLGNAGDGIYLNNSPGTMIGGTFEAERNVISGNGDDGIYLSGANNNVQIIGNYIGTTASGEAALPNAGDGLEFSGATNCQVGPENVIAFNGQSGVEFNGSTTKYNRVTQSSFYQNVGKGISLVSGAQENVSYPYISAAQYYPTLGTFVTGTSAASAIIEVFLTEPTPETQGEGITYLGVTTESSGWNVLVTGVTLGATVCATATDVNNNTSEFSLNFVVDIGDLTPPTVTVEAPASGEVWAGGSTRLISFEASDPSGIKPNSLSIWYSTDEGVSYPHLITADATVSSPYSWTLITDVTTTLARVKVTVKDNCPIYNQGTGESGVFTIDSSAPYLTGIVLRDRVTGSTAYAKDRVISLEALNVSGDPAQMIISQSATFGAVSWIAYLNPATFEVSSGDGTKEVYYKLRDTALNTSATVESSIILDTAAPQPPTTTSPTSGETGVELDIQVETVFNKNMNPDTINTSTFILTNGGTVSGTVTYDAVSRTARFIPTALLAESTLYTVRLTTGIKDLAGNPLASQYLWTFTTKSTAVPGTPEVSAVDPTGKGVSLQPTITVTFTRAMNLSSVQNAFSITPFVPVSVDWSADKTAFYFLADNVLATGTHYVVNIADTASAEAGYRMEYPYVFDFTTVSTRTADTYGPRIVKVVPASGESGVSVRPSISVLFSEGMSTPETTSAIILPPGGSPWSTGWSGSRVIFTAGSSLQSNITHTVTVGAGARDLAGNALINPQSWGFTTSPDTVSPTVVSITSGNDVAVSAASPIRIAFSEAISQETLAGNVEVRDKDGNLVSGTLSWDGTTNSALFVPDSALDSAGEYTIVVKDGVTDISGNPLAEEMITTFLSADSVGPVVSGVWFNGRRHIDNDVISPSALLTAEVTDASGVDYGRIVMRLGPYFTVTKNEFKASDSYENHALSYQISPALTEGTCTITIEVYDSKENVASWEGRVRAYAGEVKLVPGTTPFASPATFSPLRAAQAGHSAGVTMVYELTTNSTVDIHIYGSTGAAWSRRYVSGENGGRAGYNAVAWDGRDVTGNTVGNGVYAFRIISSGRVLGTGYIVVLE